MNDRVTVLHGVNFDVLGRRPAALYGGLTLEALEVQIKRYADELDLTVAFSQTNHEGDYCEALHNATGARADPQPGGLDALLVGDPGRARGGRRCRPSRCTCRR